MIRDTPPAPISECLMFQMENLIQLYIIRKCLFCNCAKWIMLWFFFLVHFVYIHLEYWHFMAEWNKPDICFTWSYKLLSGYYDVSTSILDLSCFWGFWRQRSGERSIHCTVALGFQNYQNRVAVKKSFALKPLAQCFQKLFLECK